MVESLLCSKLRRGTTLEACVECDLVVAPTTRDLVTSSRALFTEERFYSAYQDIENARLALRDGKNASAVTQSCNAVESTMRACHEKLGRPLPRDKDITGLFKSTRDLLGLDTIASNESFLHLVNTLNGVITNLGGLRNAEGDAHGKGLRPPDVPYLVAELAINVSCALATVIIRRYRAIAEGKHE
ncbi:MAG: abortive infection family protein [Anaerolineae bacterium]